VTRSLFWRTLEVAASESMFWALGAGFWGWIARHLLHYTVANTVLAVASWIAGWWVMGLVLRDLSAWWSRCRARAQGAE
jgi:hypothetical protein